MNGDGEGQAPDAHVIVRAPPFTLEMQILTQDEADQLARGGAPLAHYNFGGRACQLEWGTARIPSALLADGTLRIEGLDGAIEGGTLHLGEVRRDGSFDPSFDIPVRRVRPPETRDAGEALRAEIGWRLCNLGLLAELPGASGSHDALIEASRRFLYRERVGGHAELDPLRAEIDDEFWAAVLARLLELTDSA